MPGGSAGYTLVNIARDKGPGGIFLDEVLVIANLIAQGIQLLIGFGRNTGIGGDPQRMVLARRSCRMLCISMVYL